MDTPTVRDIDSNPIKPQDIEAKVAQLLTLTASKRQKIVQHWRRVLQDDHYAFETAAKILHCQDDATKFFVHKVIWKTAEGWRNVVRAMLAVYEKKVDV